MKPLAFRVRPNSFEEIIGQDHLVGKNGIIKKMIDNNQLCSIILYGPAGCGKTSIAHVISTYYSLQSFEFNASCDNKNKLKDIIDTAKMYDNTILIIDEIHRMKKDIQDYLLPFVESGLVTMVGLTTENPYRAINPAIRSRAHIYRLNEITEADIINLLKQTIKKENMKNINDDILKYISIVSSCEVRSALNMLEIANMLDEDELTLENVKALIGKKAFAIDDEGESYYDITSAMIKSIRGSDPDAAIHYLARLLKSEDLEFIARRLMISAYEDIGLGNPNVGPRVYAACHTALEVGLPEARIPLAYAVVDLATSPKSNSTYLAINEADQDLDNLTSMQIPPHILNKELKSGKFTYLYPHDFPKGYVKQQYMPDSLVDKKYYNPKDTGSYERAIKDFMDKIQK